ncbi:DoxX family protein [Pedobacter yulinensis]|uniref:DoxX family protein n=1 Tax=Pedobacter yulinensis TaxID=2126353 RepID=A0A2T3HS44_9SPHI|nr:DoxX family protein [Pedobacter yulinensis]PST85274.1 DoxX family protein [Pedobacter yulinensis]
MNNQIAYLFARLALGVSLAGHGLVRIPKLTGFSNWMLGEFEKSWLPDALVRPFSLALPWLELLFGALLILGLLTRPALAVTGLIMLALIFGSTTIENWNAVSAQLGHMVFVVFLLYELRLNRYALDSIIKK